MFIPGETIAFNFTVPFVRSDIGRIYVTYYQDDEIVLEKRVAASQITRAYDKAESYFTVTLSQAESLLFNNCDDFTIQLNVVLTTGVRCASYEMKGKNGMQHIKEVVTSSG